MSIFLNYAKYVSAVKSRSYGGRMRETPQLRRGGGGRRRVHLPRDHMQQVPKARRLAQCGFLLTRVRCGRNSALVPVSEPAVRPASSRRVAECRSMCRAQAARTYWMAASCLQLPPRGGSRLPPRRKPPGRSAGPEAGTGGSAAWNGPCEAAEAHRRRTG